MDTGMSVQSCRHPGTGGDVPATSSAAGVPKIQFRWIREPGALARIMRSWARPTFSVKAPSKCSNFGISRSLLGKFVSDMINT